MSSEDGTFWADINGLKASKGGAEDLASSLTVILRSLRNIRVQAQTGAGTTAGIRNPVKQKLDGLDQVIMIAEMLKKTLMDKGEGLGDAAQLYGNMNDDANKTADAHSARK
ncbi:hypothetical protein ACWDKQ_28805 [Saccharopolyspora sp. NPDC000995]